MGKLAVYLCEQVETRVSALSRVVDPKRNPCVVIAGRPEIGDVLLYVDDDEITVVVGNFGHFHIEPPQIAGPGNSGKALKNKRLDQAVLQGMVDECLGFLADLFADRVVLWVDSGRHSCGFVYVDHLCGEELFGSGGSERFLWSGPMK